MNNTTRAMSEPDDYYSALPLPPNVVASDMDSPDVLPPLPRAHDDSQPPSAPQSFDAVLET